MNEPIKPFVEPAGSACRIHLPMITPDIRKRFSEWIDAHGWTQEAVDFACLLKEHCMRSPDSVDDRNPVAGERRDKP
jgi:hypothetical protein